jgi:hypothetical protein
METFMVVFPIGRLVTLANKQTMSMIGSSLQQAGKSYDLGFQYYFIAVDWTGSLFCRAKLTWDYINQMVNLHMPNYITKALLKYQHPAPLKPQHAPCKAAPIQFGALVQTVTTDITGPLSKECIKCMQDIVGTLLYYGRAVDPTILLAISAIPS